jgi:hypothetical protein
MYSEIKSMTAMAKSAFNNRRLFPPGTEHKCKEETTNLLHLEHSFMRH